MSDFDEWLRELDIDSMDHALLLVAFTHKSYKGMGNEDAEDNERFEFLGDAVLDLITAVDLFHDETLTESEMTEIRKTCVSNDQLAVVFDLLEMKQFVRTAKNLKLTTKIKAGFVEAFFGILYHEKGYEQCHKIWQVIQEKLSKVEEDEDEWYPSYQSWHNDANIESKLPKYDPRWITDDDIRKLRELQKYLRFKGLKNCNDGYKLKNSKTTLQEFCQSHQFGLPEYQVIKRTGPDHAPNYTVKLIVEPGSNKIGFKAVFGKTRITTHGKGRTIKLAQKRAAEQMCDRIGLKYRSDTYVRSSLLRELSNALVKVELLFEQNSTNQIRIAKEYVPEIFNEVLLDFGEIDFPKILPIAHEYFREHRIRIIEKGNGVYYISRSLLRRDFNEKIELVGITSNYRLYDTFKIVVFGDSTDKKKFLMERFVQNLFTPDAKMAIGVEFSTKILVVDNQKVKLLVWDISGEERFRYTVPIHVRGALGGLFMFDTTSHTSIAHIDDWLTIIKKKISELFPIICVGLKSKNNNNREVSREEGIKIARSRGLDGYIECDVETGENVENMFQALVQLVLANF